MILIIQHREFDAEGRKIQEKIGRCACGREVILEYFTCACDCGRDYNSSGQELAPRSQWGEETGESLADILSVDYRCYPEGD